MKYMQFENKIFPCEVTFNHIYLTVGEWNDDYCFPIGLIAWMMASLY